MPHFFPMFQMTMYLHTTVPYHNHHTSGIEIRSISWVNNPFYTKNGVSHILSARRSKFQLSVEVLDNIKNGETKPTRIMYSCNLSWKSLKDILQNLSEQELLEETVVEGKKRSKKLYHITPKGENVLKYYRMVSGLIEVEPIRD